MINFHSSNPGEITPKISVIGIGGAGGNAVNNMIQSQLEGVEFIVANTDAQSLAQSRTDRRIQLGLSITQGLGAGARPDIGRASAEETLEEILNEILGSNMVFITAGMGGGTGTGAAPVVARAARENGILTIGVVTKPFDFEGKHRMRLAEQGIEELSQHVDTLIVIPNQNLFRIASEKTTFADAFKMADNVLYSGVRSVTDLMIMPGMVNLDFADIRTVMGEMGKAMMGTGEGEGEKRALDAAEAAINNPLLDDISMKGAHGVLVNITGGPDITLLEVDEAMNRIRSEVDPDANIIFGSTYDNNLNGKIRVSVVATGIDAAEIQEKKIVLSVMDSPQPKAQEMMQPALQVEPVHHQADVRPVQKQPAQPQAASAARHASAETNPLPFEPDLASNEPPLRAEARTQASQPSRQQQADQRQGRLSVDSPAAHRSAREAGQASESSPNRAYPAAHAEPPRPGFVSDFISILTGGRSATPDRAQTQQGAAPQQPRMGAAQPQRQVQPQPQPRPQARPQQEQPQMQQHIQQTQAAPALSQAPRVNPSDRLQTSQSGEEELLDIPAFLRRQAN